MNDEYILSRLSKLDSQHDPLRFLNEIIDWDLFLPTLSKIQVKVRKSTAGRKPFPLILMFKILILKSLYSLSDDEMEYQILDRLSFMRFLGLDMQSKVPDAKTIWHFQNELTKHNLISTLFHDFNQYLRKNGFTARQGQIIDASFVHVPVQHNSASENESIKEGEIPNSWTSSEQKPKLRQKDVDARWTKKNGTSHFGYKNHISVDVEHKFIRSFAVTDASVHDSNIFCELFDYGNRSRFLYADSAYSSKEHRDEMKKKHIFDRVLRKGYRNSPLSDDDKQRNHKLSKIRVRVEHVFGDQYQRMRGKTMIKVIGKARATLQIGVRNIAYNIMRLNTILTA